MLMRLVRTLCTYPGQLAGEWPHAEYLVEESLILVWLQSGNTFPSMVIG